MASFSAMTIRSLLLIFGICKISDGGSKQILQSLLKQTNHNIAMALSVGNGTRSKETKIPIFTSSQAQEETDASQTKSYQEFHKLFYGVQEPETHLERSGSPNDISRGMGSIQELEDVRQANEHFLKIRRAGRCRTPISKIIQVNQYYPDASKEYLPRCTILHRCGEDSGCCDNDAFHCVASMIQEVSLPFYTFNVGRQGLKVGNTIEKLLFINHTQCECHPVNDQPRIEENVSMNTTQSKNHSHGTAHHHTSNVQRCRECPIPFYRREYSDGLCTCDCFDRQRPCLRIKRGRDPLADVERRCVESGYCHVPECEYGEYDVMTGQCPKRLEFDQRRASNRNYQPSGQRWSLYERD